jgi:cell division transport system ATP-binding protein
VIQFFHVGKRYPGGQTALDDVTFHIPRGQFVFLTGASGAGKTTLLKLIFREEVPNEGSILVNGRNVASLPRAKIPYLRRTLGVVFQDFRLIPRKTVFENVTYLPHLLGLDAKAQKKLAYQALRRVGLAHRLKAFPTELSGGEQQRVAIARALINEPELLIADEPTGNLDPELSAEILRLFLDINRRGTTLLIATHDRELIHRTGRRVLTLDHGRLVRDEQLQGDTPEPRPPRIEERADGADEGTDDGIGEGGAELGPQAAARGGGPMGEAASLSGPAVRPPAVPLEEETP